MMHKKIFLPCLLVFASASFAGTPLTYEQALQLAEPLFAGKTLVGDDGTVQDFGPLEVVGTTSWFQVSVTKGDGSILQVIDTFIDVDGAALLIENIAGSPDATNYRLQQTDAGELAVLPMDAVADRFVSRICGVEEGLTVCRRTVRGEDGRLIVATYREQVDQFP